MKHHAARIAACIAVVAVALTLTACGGGGGDSPDPVDLLLDPDVLRLGLIIEQSNTLITPGLHLDYSASIGSASPIENPEEFLNAECITMATCDIDTEKQGTETTRVLDLINLSVNVGSTEISLGSRGEFDTIDITSHFDVSDFILRDASTLTPPTATTFGLWGVHGFAAVTIGDGPLAGEVRQEVLGVETTVPFAGQLKYALAYAMGRAAIGKPKDTGSATWQGIVEAASVRNFERREGTVRISIADLANQSDLRASVEIDIEGSSIAEPGWDDVPLTDGGFTTGTVGSDYLAGNFYGQDHEEAYGVFDTLTYTGAFGAKRGN